MLVYFECFDTVQIAHACLRRIFQCGRAYLYFTYNDIYICYTPVPESLFNNVAGLSLTSCMFYFPKFEVVKVLFPKCLKCFGSYFCEVEIVWTHFHFQKGFKFPRLRKIFGNVFQISEVEYVTVMPSGISNVGNFHHTENI